MAIIADLKQMKCGNCGHDQFKIYTTEKHHPESLHVECSQCKSTTILTVSQPRIMIGWGQDSEGILSVF